MRLSRFLLWYRITPHSTTGSSPSELMWGRRLRSKLDLVLLEAERRSQEAQDRQKRAHDSHSADRQFRLNNTVYVRNYGVGQWWVPGCVVGLLGSAMYRVRLDNNNVVIRHVDQLCHRVTTTDTSDSSDSFEDPETGNTTETVGPESTELTQYPPGVSETPLTQATPLSAASESEEQTETSSEETDGVSTPETDSADQPEGGGANPALRCSTRVSRPPVRLEETVSFI